MKQLIRLTACVALAGLALLASFSACADEDAILSVVAADGDRATAAFALANDIVTGMAKSYADRRYDGKMRSYALDLSRLGTPEQRAPEGALEIEDGLRRMAERLPGERASWIFRFESIQRGLEPTRRGGRDRDTGRYRLAALVVDLHAEYCCDIEAASLSPPNGRSGWQVIDIGHGGRGLESSEFRQERLARGNAVLR